MTVLTCPSEKRIKALTLGQLPESESDHLFDHIRNCEDCKNLLDRLGDPQDSLIENIRCRDQVQDFSEETDCNHAISKAMGVLTQLDSNQSFDFPAQVGEYEILRPIGEGGMGKVYLARHTKLGRLVALKVLAAHRLADSKMQSRFEQEMQTIGRLSHPNIVAAHDAREVDGTAVLVTEFIDGLDVAQILQKVGPLSIDDACEIARFAAVALDYTGQQGFVHRDIKPSNVMISREGQVKLLDLGLARFHLAAEPADITATGQAMGTADYLAPEQVTDSKSVDQRADIYALGCTLFKLLTGRAPFADADHTSAFAKMHAHVNKTPPPLESLLPIAPRGLCKLVDSMLAKSPENRPRSASEVAQKLAAFSNGSDLQTLVAKAISASQRDVKPPHHVARPTTPSKQKSRSGLLAVAVGLLGLMLGFALGVLIVVKYPDGTVAQLFAPEGSEISLSQRFSHAAVNELPGTRPNGNPVLEPRQASPPAFAIAATPSPEELKLAREALTSLPANQSLLATPYGLWVEISENLSQVGMDDAIGMQGNRIFVLLQNRPSGSITLKEAVGKLAANLTWDAEQKSKVADIFFRGELQDRIRTLTKNNIGRKLAVVAGSRIISFVTINAEIGATARLYGTEEDIERFVDGLNKQSKPDDGATWLNGLWKVDLDAEEGNTDLPAYVACWQGTFVSYQNGSVVAIGKYAALPNGFVSFQQISDGKTNLYDIDVTAKQIGPNSLELIAAGTPEGFPGSQPVHRIASVLPASLTDAITQGNHSLIPRLLYAIPGVSPPVPLGKSNANATSALDLSGIWVLNACRPNNAMLAPENRLHEWLTAGARGAGCWLVLEKNRFWFLNGSTSPSLGSFETDNENWLTFDADSSGPLPGMVTIVSSGQSELELLFTYALEDSGTKLTFTRVAATAMPGALKKLLANQEYSTVISSFKRLVADRLLQEQSNPLIPLLDLAYVSTAYDASFPAAITKACGIYTDNRDSQTNKIIGDLFPIPGVTALQTIRSRQDLKTQHQWLLDHTDYCYLYGLDTDRVLLEVEKLVDQITGAQGVFQEVLAGMKSDPNGPKIDLRKEVINKLSGELYVVCDAELKNSEYPSEGWMAALRLVDPESSQEVTKTIQRMLEMEPPDTSKFRAFQSAGGDIKVVDQFLLIGDPQKIQLAELRQLKTSEPLRP